MKILCAHQISDFSQIRDLFIAYQQELDVDLGFQAFSHELETLPGKYAPPDGQLILLEDKAAAAGCVALRKLEPGVCEMKRLYVNPNHRAMGIGRLLAQTIIQEAAAMGYAKMRLDTLQKLDKAMALYASLGFKPCAPYYRNPLPDAVYWELELT